MLKNYVILILVIGLTTQTCVKGCLKCTVDDKCVLCDTSSNYKLSADSCSLVDLPNCSLINLSGDCNVCNDGYWLNTTTKKCIVVETEKMVTNCEKYTSSQTCQTCKSHFYIEEAKCKAVTTQITNCEENKNALLCEDCKDGYFVSSDEKKCESIPSISNCKSFSRFKCENCLGSFFLNNNLYFKNDFKTSSDSEKENLLSRIVLNKYNGKILENSNVCQSTTVTNCSEYETFDLCKTCNSNYFLGENKKCFAYPKSVISNCSKYSSNTTCIECTQGFYLSSSIECKVVATVENCSTYSQSSNTSKCEACSAEFYLASTTSCAARVVSAQALITNCKTKSINSDKCSVCNTGFILSTGGDECATALSNCDSHNAFAKGATPVCSVCIVGFYLDGNVCKAGTDVNCEIFANGGNCSKCKNKFYHVGTAVCEAHIANSNCLTYSDSGKNTCLKCENDTFNYLITNKCNILTAIANCVTYNHTNDDQVAKCGTCAKKYYESLDGLSCILIGESNCARVNNNAPTVCLECNTGYNLFVHGGGATTECRIPHEFISAQCNEVTTTGTNRLNQTTCKDCKMGSITVDYENNYACINDELIKDDHIGLPSADLISGCLKYDGDKCVMCEANKFLKSDQLACLDVCPTTNTSYAPLSPLLNSANANHYFIDRYNICLAAATTKEKVYGPDSQDASALLLLSCTTSSIPVVDVATFVIGTPHKSSNLNLSGTGTWVHDIGTVNPKLTSCQDLSAGIEFYGSTSTNTTLRTPNCKYYSLDATDYGCLRCNHGFSAKANAADTNHLDSNGCTTMTSCLNDEYGNIPAYWSKFFSCHKCKSANEIPYLVYDMSTDPKFVDYLQYDFNGTQFNSNNTNKTMECLNNVTEATFKTQIGDSAGTVTTVAFVANCGLGLLDISKTRANFNSASIAANDYSTLSSAYCAACKPGYKPTIRDAHTVKSCAEITNCSNSTWFNSCSQCNTGFAFNVDSGVIDYTECVANTDVNCLAAAATSKCSFCKKGFAENADGFCVRLKTPKCQDNQFVPFLEVDNVNKKGNLNYLYWYNELGAGCNKCDAGYTAVKYNSSGPNFQRRSCAFSDYVSTNSSNFPNNRADGSSVYINNCLNYKVIAGAPVCNKCSGNFVLRDNGSECISVLNCVTALDASIGCKICATGYGLTTGGACVLGTTLNCATYNISNAHSSPKCLTCNEGFYLTATNTCEEGSVANCKVHGATAKRCDTCKAGYFLLLNNLLNGDYDYCYKFDESLNCSTVTITNNANKGGSFNCTGCSVGNSVIKPVLVSENQSNCLSYNLIKDCESYNVGNDLNTSSFACSVCKTGFYHTSNGFKCVRRTILPSGCKTYENNADLCSVCNDGNFLSSNKKECTPYPSGVIGCMTYSNSTTCTSCGANTWLNEGVCTNVEADAKVENCSYYLNATTCSKCQASFFLEGNSCVALNVQNCLTYASKDACETCLPNYKLKTENGTTTCEAFTKANCQIFDQSGTNPCLKCNQNFFINTDGDCAPATPLITHCLTNITIDKCSICAKGFALSVDKKTCINASAFDSNCTQINMPSDMNCSKCSPGYYFKDGSCTVFVGKSIANGCFSQDIDDDKVCLICNTGYYMNKSLDCVKIESSGGNEGGESGKEKESFEIMRSLIVMFIGFVFMF